MSPNFPHTPRPKAELNREIFFSGIRIIKRHLAPHRKMLIILTALGLIDAVTQAFVPLVSGKIFDAIIAIARNEAARLMPIVILIVVWLILQMGDNAISWWTGFNNDKVSTYLNSEYIANGFSRVLEMPLSFHVVQKQGDIVDRINRAANGIDNIVGSIMLTLLPNFLSIAVAVFITLFINWRLTIVLVVGIAIYSAILWKAIPGLNDLQQRMNAAYNQAYADTYDLLGNIREVKQAATEKIEQKKLRVNFIDRAAQFWVEMNNAYQGLNVLQKILVTATQFLIFAISIFLVRSGTLTPGGLVAFNAYAAMIFGPFVILGRQWQTVQNGMVALVRSEELLDVPTEIYEPAPGTNVNVRATVAFKNVSFSYPNGSPIVRGISFEAKPGEKIALVGESGVGKTTIIDLISAFYFPTAGMITVGGTDLRTINLQNYRSRIGVVPQEPTLFNDTIEANIRYGNSEKSREDMIAAAKEAHAHEFIEKFPEKYNQIVGWRGVKLSIGQKQRIALARAFLRNPDILILDEPTSALDAQSEHLIKASLERLMKGRTTFIIAHRLSTVREVNEILVLKDGKIAEHGTHDELMRIPNGTYRALYELQVGFTK